MPKASQERRERAANEMRRIILDAAEHLLIQGGPDQVTIRKIAALLDYAPPSLYYYVADKEAVLDSLAQRHGAQIVEAMTSAAGPGPREPMAWLKSLGCSYVGWALANPMYYLILFRRRTGQDRPAHAERLLDLFIEPMAIAQKQGRIRRDIHPRDASHTVWAALHGLAHLRITHTGLVEYDDGLIGFQIEAILKGLRGP